jgi:hypothetical protein
MLLRLITLYISYVNLLLSYVLVTKDADLDQWVDLLDIH